MSTCPHGPDAAAYVLSSLPEEDAARFRAHAADCADCRAELESLQVAAQTLPGSVAQVDPPPELKRRIMAVVEAEAEVLRAAGPEADRPPRRRWWLAPAPAVALACALLLAGLGLGALLRDSGGADVRTVTAAVTGRAEAARAEVRVEGDRGQLVLARMPAPPPDRIYQMWLLREDGRLEATDALFAPSREGDTTVEVPGSLEGVAKVMVTDEPRGGSEAPTRTPVVEASLS